MRFAKYQGIGNDFVMLADPGDRITLNPELVRALTDRRFGVGGDGVIRVAPGTGRGELVMDYYNSDGSAGEMCGNGIRCLALFALENGLTASTELAVETIAGLKVVEVLPGGHVRVDMGPPVFSPSQVPVLVDGADALHTSIDVGGTTVEAACLSMGNPHAVLFVDDLEGAPVTTLGPALENHDLFPNKTNVEFVRVESPELIRMAVWERGSGATLACGTGACAAAVAAHLLRDTKDRVRVELPGGELEIEWPGSLEGPGAVMMTGPAEKSFEGELDLGRFL